MPTTPFDPSKQQHINIGTQSNDGTGDSIRDAFNKTNANFDQLFEAVTTIGTTTGTSTSTSGLRFSKLQDYAGHRIVNPLQRLTGNRVISTRSTGTVSGTAELVMSNLVAGQGMAIQHVIVDSTNSNIVITNTSSRLSTDLNPYLSANLSGTSTYRAVKFANPIADQDLVTRKFLYDNFLNRDGITRSGTETNTSTVVGGSTLRDNVQLLTTATTATHLVNKFYADTKISRAGIDAIDSFTGQANPSFGTMTGPLILSRKPVKADDIDNGGYIAATKNYVDDNTFYSSNNLFITKKGRDFQPDVPPEKRGRNWQYAFGSLNYAARYAEQLIAVSQIEVGDYARLITHDAGTPCTVTAVEDDYYGNNLAKLTLNAGENGSDQFGSVATGRFTIFPGQYVQGVDSNAIALIEGIDEFTGSSAGEIYRISYVDYGDDFDTQIRVESISGGAPNQVRLRFFGPGSNRMVPIPEFWIGYKFYTDPYSDEGAGIITAIESVVDNAGIYDNSFIVEFGTGYVPSAGQEYLTSEWHVYSGDFIPGETVVYNTDVSALQISFMIESGEYSEQYPIRLANNTSIRGDEFRRVIIRPAKGVSNSPWSDIYFRRDAQIDGLQTVEVNTATDYATAATLNGISVTPNTNTSGVSTFSLSVGGVFPEEYVGYVFEGGGGKGVVLETTPGGFVVKIGSDSLDNLETIPAGSWHLYEPITFGYQYLKDPTRPLNVLNTATNVGGFINASALITANRTLIQNQSITYLEANYPDIALTYNRDKCFRDVGIIVDGIAYDMLNGGWLKTVNAGDSYRSVAVVKQTQLTATVQTVYNINNIVQNLFVANPASVETNASMIAADLVQMCARIINNDVDYNPPKDNSQMDVFLCNDANVLRYLSCQNHGGFMMVLDPQGQIKNKSPYCQTASSFSQSIAKQRFAGGMFVDGFAGNVQCYPVDVSDPLKLQVSGLRRRPQVPTFFNVRGVRYEVDFFADFAEDIILPDGVQSYTATLRLNPLTPGGIPNTVSLTDNAGGFKANQTNMPIIIDQPSGVGGLGARGYATTNGSGQLDSIVITFPGTGYTSVPNITVGGAIFNNLVIVNGGITTASIVSGGSGYAVGGTFKIVPTGAIGAVQATGTITAVDSNGAIGAFTINTNGSNWDNTVQYRLEFGDLAITVPDIVAGFIDSVPDVFELVTAGNRSMLANDYTQVNDLGYGILCTNGGLAEDVSMFTYYCYRAYYSCNGAQIRSTTGSCGYGEYALTAEGSDPNEVPTDVALSYPLTQVARAYVNNPLFPAVVGQTSIFITIDPLNGGYPPLNGSQVEINHSGIIKTYTVGSASPALDANNNIVPNVYELYFTSGNAQSGTGNLGLLATVANNDVILVRAQTLVKLTGLNPDTVSRPSTSLVFNDDPTYVYHVTGYSTLQPDSSVFVYTLENYNYITFQSTEQGLTYPIIDNPGSGYTTATVNIGISQTTGITHTVQGDQGAGTAGIQTITLSTVSNILIGHIISGDSIITGTVVTYINSATNVIGLGLPTTGLISSGTVLTFSAIPPQVFPVISSSGTIASISVSKGGVGWNVTTTTITVSGDGVNAQLAQDINIAGVPGSRTIKISPLDLTSQNRIASGLTSNPTKYYQFAVNDQFYNVVAYRSPTQIGQAWAEIDIDRPLNKPVAQGTILRAGLPVNSGGTITSRISTMRATGHDFLNIGTGGYATTRYPNDLYGPPLQAISQVKEITEINKGRVYYMSTDQDGNFRVGSALRVNQAQGSVSISVPIDLSNLTSISLKRDLGPPINEFSTDNTMITEADYKVPTEQAVANYINRRLGLDRNGAIYPGSALGPQFLDLKGLLHMKGTIQMDQNWITGMPSPRPGSGSDATNKDYVDGKISLQGTKATDTNGTSTSITQGQGVMAGPLQLFADPDTVAVTVIQDAFAPTKTLYLSFEDLEKLSREAQVNGANIRSGTRIEYINYNNNTISLTQAITGTILTGAVISVDPIAQAVTKKYVDKFNQLNQLNDVTLTNPINNDFLMFGPPLVVSTTTNPPVYNAGTRAVNVANNVTTITNNTTSNGGGSDLTVTRSANTVTFKLVGGQGSNNPITDYHVNNDAQVQQTKLWLNTATVSASAPSGTQRDIQLSLGSAQFDNVMFTANNGWISLRTATTITDGIIPTKHAFVPAGGGLLGATNTAANNAASYVSSASIQTWLQNIGSAWSFNGNLNPQTDILQGLGTSSKRWSTIYANTATLNGGLVLNTNARISTDQTTGYVFTTTVTNGNLFLTSTSVNIGANSGTLTIGNPTVVGTEVSQNLFNSVATTLNIGSAAATMRIGATSGTLTVGNPTVVGTQVSQDLFNSVATTLNIGSAAATMRIGANSGTLTVGNPTVVGTQVSQDLFNSVATTLNIGSAAATMRIGANSGTLTIGNPTVVGTEVSQNLYNSVATTLNVGSAATTMRIGATSGTLTIGNPTVVGTGASQTLYNTVATTVDAFGAATTLNIGNAGGANLIRGTTTLNTLAAAAGGSTVSGAWTLNSGATFQATYADLAEWYSADAEYEPGTVLVFGGDAELTITAISSDTRVAGVVTTDPAYIMNVGQEGTRACIALVGRVPVKVIGKVKKGDLLTTSHIPGYAVVATTPTVGTIIGKALENKDTDDTGVIQVAIGRN